MPSSLDTIILNREDENSKRLYRHYKNKYEHRGKCGLKKKNTDSAATKLDTHILNTEEENPKRFHRHHKNKCDHRQRSGHKKKKYTDSAATRYITQKIHIDRQDYKCIINMNTMVCDNENNVQSGCNGKSSKGAKSNDVGEHPVPHCLRPLCQRRRHHDHGQSKNQCTTGLHQQTQDLNRVHKCLGRSKHMQKKSRHSKHQKIKESNKQNLAQKHKEPKLNFTPVKQLETDWEEVSNKSLERYLEIPLSYKNVVRTYKKDYHESKLDTLIKRTKERERKLVEQSRGSNPWYTSTPAYAEVSSGEFPMSCSEIDLSLYSQSTFVLEPRDHGYTPSEVGYCLNAEECLKYSPTSPICDGDCMLVPESNFRLIKQEPTMDIEAYSPTEGPDLQTFTMIDELLVKKEIKIESKEETRVQQLACGFQ